ncbi:MAG: MopE-related protein [Sandaracinus sp.]
MREGSFISWLTIGASLMAWGCPGTMMGPEDTGSDPDAGGIDASSMRDDANVMADAPESDTRPDRVDAFATDVGPPDAGMPDTGCSCDDGIECTTDSCVGRACEHVADHTRCTDGQYCDPASGCRAGGPCATVADCSAPDPCAVPRCDASMRRCMYSVLDGDRDGEAPIVCGGTDCDDSRAAISAGADETCDGTDQDCDGRVDEDNPGGSTACGDRSVCTAGACVCEIPGGWCPDFWGGGCRDLSTDTRNCGACGRACLEGQPCVDGVCVCDAGLTFCATADAFGTPVVGCTDTRTDELNCGGCARPCPTGVECVAGVCACPAGQTSCNPWGDAPECVDLSSDSANCGECGVTCPAGVACVAGRCPCSAGGVNCTPWDEMCIDLASDTQHCGRCLGACSAGTCRAGVCTCDVGETACPYRDPTGIDYGVFCVDLRSDPTSCGACGRSCGDGRLCTDGACGVCAEGFTECPAREGRVCADILTNPQHCGLCGRACAWPLTRCVSGRCVR